MPNTSVASDTLRRATFGKVFLILLLDLLGFTVILPLLPSLLDYYGHQKDDITYNTLLNVTSRVRRIVGAPDTPRWNSVLFGGILGSMFSLLQFVSSPVMGALSDVYGRKPILIVTMIGTALSYVLWACSSTFSLFVVARVLGGLSKANVGVATATISDVSDRQSRGRGMALVGIAFSLGFLFGPATGAYFSRLVRAQPEAFFVYPAIFSFLLAALDIVFIIIFFNETLSNPSSSLTASLTKCRHLVSPPSLFSFSAVTNLAPAKHSATVRVGLTHFTFLLIYSGLEFTLTFLVHLRFRYDSIQQGKMFLFIGCIMLIVQGGYVRRLKPGSEVRVALRGIILLVPAFIIIGVVQSSAFFYTGLACFAFASATVVPCLTTIISLLNQADEQGKVIGIFRSLGALARAFGPCIASAAFWSVGPAVTYITGAVFLVIPFVLLLRCSDSKSELSKYRK